MAGRTGDQFKEKVSPFLKEQLEEGSLDDAARRVLERQYFYDSREQEREEGEVRRHYEAELGPAFEGHRLRGVERLYRRSMVIEPTMICAAHCRWCVRGQYEFFHLDDADLRRIARYVGMPERQDVREVVITGGDPLATPRSLRTLLQALREEAPQVQIYRIGTRVPLQQPALVNDRLLDLIGEHAPRLEIALHVNHRAELFDPVIEAILALRRAGARIYNQSVLLRGVNDDFRALAELLDALRELQIEMHYLFHAVPLRGMKHHRTTVDRGLELSRALTSNGLFSGRAKPTFSLLTDVGKVVPYEGTILERRSGKLLLQTYYRLDERREWNPGWRMPDSASLDGNGHLRVWYRDGSPE